MDEIQQEPKPAEVVPPNEGYWEKYKKYLPLGIAVLVILLGGLFSWSRESKIKESREEVKTLSETLSTQQTQIVTLKESLSNVTDQKKEMETRLVKMQKDLEKTYSKKKYDPVTGKLVEDISRDSHSSESSSDDSQRQTEEILSLASKVTETQTENDLLKKKIAVQEDTLKTAFEKSTKSRGGFGIDAGFEASKSSISPSFGVHYTVLTIPLIDIDLGVKVGYSVDWLK